MSRSVLSGIDFGVGAACVRTDTADWVTEDSARLKHALIFFYHTTRTAVYRIGDLPASQART
jgi:hypothetical protein